MQIALKRQMYTNVSQKLQLYIYCSMNKQYVKAVKNWKKDFFDECNIAM